MFCNPQFAFSCLPPPRPRPPNVEQTPSPVVDDAKREEIGEIVAQSIIIFWEDESNICAVNNCIQSGVQLLKPKINTSEHLNNTIFAFTGTLELMNRNDAKKKVENAGGLTKNSLTKKTTHLVAGQKTGSKVEKAKKMGIIILSENEFIELLNNN